jgi:hydroxymethylglutaryl-CoA reductase
MLFQVKNLAGATDAIAAAVRAHDAGAVVTHDVAAGQIKVSAQLTSNQIIAALHDAGHEASRVSEPRQIHVSGGSDCCGSCS